MSFNKLISNWRKQANQVIWKALNEQGIFPGTNTRNIPEHRKKQIVKAVKRAYPFGLKENHPYRIWLSELDRILSQLGLKKKRKIKPVKKKVNFHSRILIGDPRQGRFF